MTDLVPLPSSQRAAALESLAARANGYANQARASATLRAYRSDWVHFSAWCTAYRFIALPAPPETIGGYLAAHAGTLSVATLTRRLSSIAIGHRNAGYSLDTKHPAIRDVMGGIRRTHGVAQRQAAPMTVPVTRLVVATCAGTLIDRRDRALVLAGVAGAFRRSELVALDVADLAAVPEGYRITIRRSKSDQDGEGQVIQLGRTGRATCPVGAVEAWIAAAGLTAGPLFRSVDRHGRLGSSLSTRAVADVVKKRAALAGLDGAFSGHSLRSGFATSAAYAGIEERAIMCQTRHTSATTVRRFIRAGDLFRQNLAVDMGL